MQFIFASGNLHKAEELAQLFKDCDPNLISGIVSAPSSIQVEENLSTLYGNAEIKAKAYFNKFKTPVVSDDSGLFVDALPDELGVQTARFGGEGLSSVERCELLLMKMDQIADRKAYFMCVLCFILSPEETFFFEGRLQGTIGRQMVGDKGFGYDPLFYPNELSPGELGAKSLAQDAEFKMTHSHRARASLRAKSFLQNYLKIQGPAIARP